MSAPAAINQNHEEPDSGSDSDKETTPWILAWSRIQLSDC